LGTPIVLDLNGDGVKTLAMSDGVKFDLFADGANISTGWVSQADGLLVLDRNHDGVINSGAELFGSATQLANGDKATDGYQALRELDTNHDGLITSSDAVYADLRVWVDANSDGVSDQQEIKTLASLGIAKIDLNAAAGSGLDNGNLLGLTATYETTDGQTHAAADVWFVADRTTTPSEPLTDLRARCSDMAQVMTQFKDAAAPGNALSNEQLALQAVPSQPNSMAAVTAGHMADVMRQFDPNGCPVNTPAALTAASNAGLKLAGNQDASLFAYLSAGSVK
jgi:hypothetical protein